jgi:urease subunit beta
MSTLDRRRYAALYGPTAGDRIRLAVPAGTSVRFEPGLPRDVELIPFTGHRIVPGLRGLAGGPLDRLPEPVPADPDDIEPAGSLDEDTGEDQPSNGSPR